MNRKPVSMIPAGAKIHLGFDQRSEGPEASSRSGGLERLDLVDDEEFSAGMQIARARAEVGSG